MNNIKRKKTVNTLIERHPSYQL
ncbi:Protein CBG25435 [Caenorhabditis briggsae]|uniref:Protein CBG25435 n=1 Tax=Caenorhabditis briggsae TaxID=6238 RepID=B6ILC8_CAEBR|nr:Protein CBG25435 [Caenorhabditis briggsae]CAS00708.1 Protein CBG25435 [Caenorhabditis briggsae]